ncbi:response regulator [Prosthecobacter vanneervenii]|uniref:DNA-binding NarL/FixJ family response regulator n=1 Tax=Prosthecobacter vanneervenii TaxID=48466 RepID=A0A7W8DL01_9BACT|nr:response regulator [Prosthecobacter vanneervenii]MBB5033738.1 DNA-binding NarL/FixJ family response regulator [Prosthecobacter vanneervenii]
MQQANWHSNRSGNSRIILLVEDHDMYRDVVRAALGAYLPEYDLLEADCVAAALPLLKTRRINVVVADMTLPDGSAIDLLEQSASLLSPEVKVIVLSSHSAADMLPVLSRHDVHGFISKEQGLKALADEITSICGPEDAASPVPSGGTTGTGTGRLMTAH